MGILDVAVFIIGFAIAAYALITGKGRSRGGLATFSARTSRIVGALLLLWLTFLLFLGLRGH
jgi:hypothetical protein